MLGLGTIQNPYLVSTESDLNNIRLNINANYKLVNDITMTMWQTGEGWLPIEEFKGILDGDNHTIHNLYINRASTPNIGLLSFLNEGKVINLNFKDVNVLGGYNTGVIAGKVQGNSELIVGGKDYYSMIPAVIENCKINGIVRGSSDALGGVVGRTTSKHTPTSWDSDQLINLVMKGVNVNLEIYAFSNNVGGIIGHAEGGIEVKECSTKGSIFNARENVGGLIGSIPYHRGKIENSYSTMSIQGSNYIGGLIGVFTTGVLINQTIKTSYFAGVLDYPKNRGIFVGAIVGRGQWDSGKSLVDYEKIGFKFSDIRYSGDEINASGKDGGVIECTTEQMSNIVTYYKNGFQIFDTWYDDLSSNTDTLQLRSELDINLTKLKGKGTVEEPFLISTIHDLIAIDRYNYNNWLEHLERLKLENDWYNPLFKENYKFSNPKGYHYKLTNDIDLNIFPFNQYGWIPLTKVSDTNLTKNNIYYAYNSIGEIIGSTADGITIDKGSKSRQFYTKGFIGVLNGNDFKVKNLKLKELPYTANIGFFETITTGSVKNLNFENVTVDLDRLRDGANLKTTAGVVAHRIQSLSVLDKVSVTGRSFIKDYRSDVGDSGVILGGLVYQSVRLDTLEDVISTYTKQGFTGTLLKSTISNCYVSIEHTYTNAVSTDVYGAFYPLMYSIYGTNIKDSYSTSSKKTVDRFNMPIDGTSGNDVMIGLINDNTVTQLLAPNAPGNDNKYNGKLIVVSKTKNGTIQRTYFDKNIINADRNTNESLVIGSVELYGQTTDEMKLQSTFVGWDFKRVWKSDGTSYPTFRPFDPNYVPPTATNVVIITTKVDALNTFSTSNGENRNIRRVVVKTTSKRIKSKDKVVRKGTTSPKTLIENLYAVAFEWKTPVIGERISLTKVEHLEFKSNSGVARKRNNEVSTSIDSLNITVSATGINRGMYFDGISVEEVGVKSVLVKVNDPRIKTVLFAGGYYDIGDLKYLTLRIDSNSLNEGDNLMSVVGRDINSVDIFTKNLLLNKKTPKFVNMMGNYLLINHEYYKILSHESNGTITLDRVLPTNVGKLDKDVFKTVELIEFLTKPKFSVGERGHSLTPKFIDGKFIKAKEKNGFIEEEYELEVNGEEIITQIDFTRKPPETYVKSDLKGKTVLTGTPYENYPIKVSWGRSLDSSMPKSLTTSKLTELTLNQYKDIASIGELKCALDFGEYSEYGYQIFTIDINKFVRQNISESYTHQNHKPYDFDIKWVGNNRKKLNARYGLEDSTSIPLFIWNYKNNRFENASQVISKDGAKKVITFSSINSTDFTSGGLIHVIARTDTNARILVYPEDVEYTQISTDYFEFGMKATEINTQLKVINKVEQVFIPMDNNNKDL